MRFDDSAPIVQETRKQAPCPDAARNLGALLMLSVGIGCVIILACRLVGLSLTAGVIVGAVAAAVPVLLRFDDMTLQIEESTQYGEMTAPPAPAPTHVTRWEMPLGPGEIEGRELAFDPALVLEWARAAVSEQSLSYATWGERFGGEREYAKYRAALVQQGLAVEQANKRPMLTRKGWALFRQAAERGDAATPLLARWPLLRVQDGPDDGEIWRDSGGVGT